MAESLGHIDAAHAFYPYADGAITIYPSSYLNRRAELVARQLNTYDYDDTDLHHISQE